MTYFHDKLSIHTVIIFHLNLVKKKTALSCKSQIGKQYSLQLNSFLIQKNHWYLKKKKCTNCRWWKQFKKKIKYKGIYSHFTLWNTVTFLTSFSPFSRSLASWVKDSLRVFTKSCGLLVFGPNSGMVSTLLLVYCSHSTNTADSLSPTDCCWNDETTHRIWWF